MYCTPQGECCTACAKKMEGDNAHCVCLCATTSQCSSIDTENSRHFLLVGLEKNRRNEMKDLMRTLLYVLLSLLKRDLT